LIPSVNKDLPGCHLKKDWLDVKDFTHIIEFRFLLFMSFVDELIDA